jgi:hypothetical protein
MGTCFQFLLRMLSYSTFTNDFIKLLLTFRHTLNYNTVRSTVEETGQGAWSQNNIYR